LEKEREAVLIGDYKAKLLKQMYSVLQFAYRLKQAVKISTKFDLRVHVVILEKCTGHYFFNLDQSLI